MQISGIINVYKEAGYTSHDVVARLRGILSMKKIGHTGTLDPDATGVLPVCLGQATKLCDMLTDKTKVYRATMLLGVSTDTQDISGTVLEKHDVNVTEEEVKAVIKSFVGEIDQIPPMYSALKVDGKKLVDLARKGIEVERKARKISIYSIDIISMNLPEVIMSVECSKGTYIRTLCHDIGATLKCGACMKQLERTRVSMFKLEDALKLDDIEKKRDSGELDKYISPIDSFFDTVEYNGVVTADGDSYAWNGNQLKCEYINGIDDIPKDKTRVKLYDSKHEFLGVYEWDEPSKSYKPWKLFIGGR